MYLLGNVVKIQSLHHIRQFFVVNTIEKQVFICLDGMDVNTDRDFLHLNKKEYI